LPIEELLQNLPPGVLASPAPLPSEEDMTEAVRSVQLDFFAYYSNGHLDNIAEFSHNFSN